MDVSELLPVTIDGLLVLVVGVRLLHGLCLLSLVTNHREWLASRDSCRRVLCWLWWVGCMAVRLCLCDGDGACAMGRVWGRVALVCGMCRVVLAVELGLLLRSPTSG